MSVTWVLSKLSHKCSISLKVATYLAQSAKEEATVPFLARYRRDQTNSMTEKNIRQAFDTLEELKAVDSKRERMLAQLKKDEVQISESLQTALFDSTTVERLDELYAPFKRDKTSLAEKARDLGLQPIANALLQTKDVVPFDYNSQEKAKLVSALLIEKICQLPQGREQVVKDMQRALIETKLIPNPTNKKTAELTGAQLQHTQDNFKFYENFSQNVSMIYPHQVMAINRGESKGVLKVSIPPTQYAEQRYYEFIKRQFPGFYRPREMRRELHLLQISLEHAFSRSIFVSVKNSIRRKLKEDASAVSIEQFERNLHKLLLERPISNARLLSIDPGYAHGCKAVVLSERGDILGKMKLFLHNKEEFCELAVKAIQQYHCNKVVIGNGTGSRETEILISKIIEEKKLNDVEFSLVSETGASVYSASDIANEELPHLDILYRGAVSIGRRLQNPLSELVKIPPRSIGVGMYQYDLNEKKLEKHLTREMESCVANVGVDVNTASKYLLARIPGMTTAAADQIVKNREKLEDGYKKRENLLKYNSKITPDMYTKVAGFLRVPNGENPLDNTNIHPEDYEATIRLLKFLNLTLAKRAEVSKRIALFPGGGEALAAQLKIGLESFKLIVKELVAPSADPRSTLPHAGLFRQYIPSLARMKVGDEHTGIITNVVPFGAFVDIGVGVHGLLHRSNLKRWLDNKAEIHMLLSVGDVIPVVVKGIDGELDDSSSKHKKKLRISLAPGPNAFDHLVTVEGSNPQRGESSSRASSPSAINAHHSDKNIEKKHLDETLDALIKEEVEAREQVGQKRQRRSPSSSSTISKAAEEQPPQLKRKRVEQAAPPSSSPSKAKSPKPKSAKRVTAKKTTKAKEEEEKDDNIVEL